MTKYIFLLFPLLFVKCFETKRTCADFKTGTFEFNYTINGKEKTGTFVRTKNLNIDYYENTIDSASIRWINDCEFVQKKINPKNKSEEQAIHFKILSTTTTSYTFEYQLAVKDPYKKRRVEKGLATKLK